jgi:hypothetical protein
MQRQLTLDGLSPSGDVERITPASSQKLRPSIVSLVMQIARRVVAARDRHALRWYAHESASRGM